MSNLFDAIRKGKHTVPDLHGGWRERTVWHEMHPDVAINCTGMGPYPAADALFIKSPSPYDQRALKLRAEDIDLEENGAYIGNPNYYEPSSRGHLMNQAERDFNNDEALYLDYLRRATGEQQK